MLLQAVSEVISGNPFFLLNIAINNLHWTFALFAYVFLNHADRPIWKIFVSFLVLVFFMWAFTPMFDMTGMGMLNPGLFLVFQFLIIIWWPENWSGQTRFYWIVFAFFAFALMITFNLL